MTQALRRDCGAWRFASDELRRDPQMVLKRYGSFWNVPRHYLDDRNFILAAINIDVQILARVSCEMKGDTNWVLLAVQNHGMALKYMSMEMRSNKEIVLAVIENNYHGMYFASDELRADHQVCLAAVQKNANALDYTSIVTAPLLEAATISCWGQQTDDFRDKTEDSLQCFQPHYRLAV